jgi:hypothetical protein
MQNWAEDGTQVAAWRGEIGSDRRRNENTKKNTENALGDRTVLIFSVFMVHIGFNRVLIVGSDSLLTGGQGFSSHN